MGEKLGLWNCWYLRCKVRVLNWELSFLAIGVRLVRAEILGWQMGGSVEWIMLEYRNGGLHVKEVGSRFIIWTMVDLVYKFEKKIEIRVI